MIYYTNRCLGITTNSSNALGKRSHVNVVHHVYNMLDMAVGLDINTTAVVVKYMHIYGKDM